MMPGRMCCPLGVDQTSLKSVITSSKKLTKQTKKKGKRLEDEQLRGLNFSPGRPGVGSSPPPVEAGARGKM